MTVVGGLERAGVHVKHLDITQVRAAQNELKNNIIIKVLPNLSELKKTLKTATFRCKNDINVAYLI
jgi:hypothetical protein